MSDASSMSEYGVEIMSVFLLVDRCMMPMPCQTSVIHHKMANITSSSRTVLEDKSDRQDWMNKFSI